MECHIAMFGWDIFDIFLGTDAPNQCGTVMGGRILPLHELSR
jgi:hypothetical protein